MWEAVLDGTGRSFGFHYNVLGIAPGFRADNGYVPRVGYVQPNVSNRYSWYGGPGALLERFNVFGTVQGLWNYDDFFAARSVLEDHASAQMSFTLRGGWNLGVNPKLSSYAFDPASYTGLFVASGAPITSGGTPPSAPFVPLGRIESLLNNFTIATPQYQHFDLSLGTTVGSDVDFLEASRVERTDYSATLDLRPSERLRMSATYLGSQFSRSGDGERTAFTRIPRIKVEYQLARPIFVRVVSQYTAARHEALRDPLTGDVLLVSTEGTVTPSIATASNDLRTDWLFAYQPAPGTVFFLGYGGDMSEPEPLAFQRLRRTDDAFFVKASYVFRRGFGN